MSRERLIIVGGGGHAKVLIELIRALDRFHIFGIVDPQLGEGFEVSGVPVLGDDGLLPRLLEQGIHSAVVAVGSVKDNRPRRRLYDRLVRTGFSLPVLIHPRAIVSSSAVPEKGVQVMAGAIIQADARIGENTILNTGSVTEHDCLIGGHCHICPGAVLSGGSVVGEGAFIGAGATVLQQVVIGKGAVIGAGSVVVRDVPEGARVTGVPARA